MKKFKLKGRNLIKKMNSESLCLEELIDCLIWLRDDYKKQGVTLPIKIQVETYNPNADKSCIGTLDSWVAGGKIDGPMTLTLIAESRNPDLIERC